MANMMGSLAMGLIISWLRTFPFERPMNTSASCRLCASDVSAGTVLLMKSDFLPSRLVRSPWMSPLESYIKMFSFFAPSET